MEFAQSQGECESLCDQVNFLKLNLPFPVNVREMNAKFVFISLQK